MVPLNLFSAPRVSAGLPVILFAVSCLASSQAQVTAAEQTSYGFCSGHTSSTQPTQTIYMSNVFSFPASARAGARPAFLQYVKSQDSSVLSVNCVMATSQQQASNAKQTTENMLQQQVQRSAATVHPVKLVETGWQYQAAAAPVTKTAPVTRTTTSTITNRTTRTAVPASTSTPTTSTSATSATAPANGVSSIGKTVTDTGQNTKQGATQAVQGIESSTTKTVTDSITSTTTAGQTAIQNKMKGWQDRMFHKAKTGQPTTAPAQASPQSPENTAATVPSVAPAASATSANLVATSATAPHAAPRPTIQDEGDGKHSILSIPGQTDARELTLVSGSKNVYIEDATGDKYIVMPNGEITHIPHKTPAK